MKDTKACEVCAITFPRPDRMSRDRWTKRRFCGPDCRETDRLALRERRERERLARKKPKPPPPTKPCEFCNGPMVKRPRESHEYWGRRKYCHEDCWRGSQKLRWELDVIDVRHLASFGVPPCDIAERLKWDEQSLAARLTERGEEALGEYMRYGPRDSGIPQVKVIV